MGKVVEACRGFQTNTGVWLVSQGAVRSGAEYVTRALVGMLIGHCKMTIEQAELAVKMDWNKVGGHISLPRIQSSFWPGDVTDAGIAAEFIRIIEEFKQEHEMTEFPHQPLCHCGTMEEAAEVALKNVLAVHDNHCAKWVATVLAMEYAFARALAIAGSDVEVLNNDFFVNEPREKWIEIMLDRKARADVAATLLDTLELNAGEYMLLNNKGEGLRHLYEVLKAHYEKRAAARSGSIS